LRVECSEKETRYKIRLRNRKGMIREEEKVGASRKNVSEQTPI